jgi:O-antigen/teichoic acid export membrane protein
MAILAVLQWPLSFYYGGLIGLQRQVPLNVMKIGFGLLSVTGGVLVVAFLSSNVASLLLWQILVAGLQVAVAALTLWHYVPMSGRVAQFDPKTIRGVWRFAAGMSAITVAAVLLTQLDKLIMSRLLDLKTFGYYALAGVVANALFIVIAPVFGAFMPRLSSLVAEDDRIALSRLYHQGAQLMAVLIAPLAGVLILFSDEILAIWLGSSDSARRIAPLARLLVIGTALNGLVNVPYALQLAHGWTRIGSYLSVLLLVIFVPSLLALTSAFGALGAAIAWVTTNALQMLIAVPLTHRRLLPKEARRWAFEDTAFPLLAAATVLLVGRVVLHGPMEPAVTIGAIGVIFMAALAAAALAAPDVRARIVARVQAT